MTWAIENPLSYCAILVDFVNVNLLVPAADSEEVVCRRELQVGYAIGGKLRLLDFDVLAGVAGGGACGSSRGLTE